jgi:hypothetical protein
MRLSSPIRITIYIHIYDDRLVTFPGPGTEGAISHVHVNYIPTSDGQEDGSGGEVERVVELVLQHARTTPELSLGVITMGIKHANKIQAALDRKLNGSSELSELFDTGRQERFFVKNLDRVQGDERDAIILSVGFGKDRAGNLPLAVRTDPVSRGTTTPQHSGDTRLHRVRELWRPTTPRTNEELADEMFAAFPFARIGSKIEAALERAIARA